MSDRQGYAHSEGTQKSVVVDGGLPVRGCLAGVNPVSTKPGSQRTWASLSWPIRALIVRDQIECR